MQTSYVWIGVLVLLIAIAVVIGVCVWNSKKKKGGSKNSVRVAHTADDVQTGDITELTVVTGSTGATNETGFNTIMSATIHTDSWTNRLYSNVSAFTSIGTVDASNLAGGTSTTFELASIDVRVLVDGEEALPGTITFNSTVHIVDTVLSEEEMLFLLETRGESNSFDFVTRDVLPGSHTVEVQARAITAADAITALGASVVAIIGDRSLVVQPGRAHVPCPPPPPCPPTPPPCPPKPCPSPSSSSSHC